jgi:Zn finger protein HypA/HybF involved in hydrogenase expression
VQNKCNTCGSKKATKIGKPNARLVDKVQRVRCDKCGQMRFNVIKPRKVKDKEITDGTDSNS